VAQKPETQGPVDLFGNPRLTPRQIMQQQLSALLQATAAQTSDPRTRGVSMMGAAAGGLLRGVLINKGVLPKPPEVERAERLQTARDAINKEAADKGLDPNANPAEFADLAASHFLRAGDEQAALMAIQWKQLQEANARKAKEDEAKLQNVEADTTKKLVEAGKTATETGQLDERLSLLRRQVADREKRTELFGRLTQLKTDKKGPGAKVVEIVEGYMKRADTAEKAGKPVPDYTAAERRALNELQKAGFMDRILLGGSGGAVVAPPMPAGDVDLDLSSQ